jgi:hypothetical protein
MVGRNKALRSYGRDHSDSGLNRRVILVPACCTVAAARCDLLRPTRALPSLRFLNESLLESLGGLASQVATLAPYATIRPCGRVALISRNSLASGCRRLTVGERPAANACFSKCD